MRVEDCGPMETESQRGGLDWILAPIPFTLLAAVVFSIYWRALPFSFQFDDFRNIVFNPSIHIRTLSFQGLIAANGETVYLGPNRPVAYYTFALNYFMGGINPVGYRAVNLIIHWFNACLAYCLVRMLLQEAFRRPISPLVPFVAAFLWAVHPVQTNAVQYIVQRMTSLATLFYLAGLISYIRGRRGGSTVWLLGAAVFFGLACATKEIAYVFPVCLLLYEATFCQRLRSWLNANRWVVPMVVILLLSLFPLALYLYGDGYVHLPFTWQQRVLTEFRVVGHYLSLVVYPNPARLSLDYVFPVSSGFLSPPSTLAAMAFHLLGLILGTAALVHRPIYGFAILGFYLHLVIESTVVPLELVYEHRLYLPLVFLGIGGAGLVFDLHSRSQSRSLLAALVSCALFVGGLWSAWTWQRLEVWKDPFSLWTDVLQKFPNDGRAFGNLGKEYQARGDLVEARRCFMKAYELNPRDLRVFSQLAWLEAEEGHYVRALTLLQSLLDQGVSNQEVYGHLGWVQSRLGNVDQALWAYEKALGYEPREPNLNYSVARLYLMRGNVAKAREYAARELGVDPKHPYAARILGLTGSARDGVP